MWLRIAYLMRFMDMGLCFLRNNGGWRRLLEAMWYVIAVSCRIWLIVRGIIRRIMKNIFRFVIGCRCIGCLKSMKYPASIRRRNTMFPAFSIFWKKKKAKNSPTIGNNSAVGVGNLVKSMRNSNRTNYIQQLMPSSRLIPLQKFKGESETSPKDRFWSRELFLLYVKK